MCWVVFREKSNPFVKDCRSEETGVGRRRGKKVVVARDDAAKP